MKICFVASLDSVHTVRWTKYFIDRGHEVHIISYKGFDVKNATLHCLKTFGKSKIVRERIHLLGIITYIYRAIQTAFYIKKIKPDIIHAHNVILGGFYATRVRVHPLVVTAWGTDVLIAPKVSFILEKIARLVLKRADILTCDGHNTKEAMIHLGADPGKIRIIYFGIDTNKNMPGKRDEKLRGKLQINDAPVVISLRSFNPIYSIETIIRAIPLVIAQIPNAGFILAGAGPQKAYLNELTLKLGIEKNVIFTGNLPEEEIPVYLASSDVYVSTSLSDSGLAASTGEAMACGLPVISTDVGAIRDWIIDGESGFIIPPEEPVILSEKIIYLLSNRSIMKRFGEINRKIIEDKQDYFKEMGKMEKICGELIRNHKENNK